MYRMLKIAIDTKHQNMALAIVGHIPSDLISEKMVLLCKDIDQAIPILVCIAITIFAPNRLNKIETLKTSSSTEIHWSCQRL